MSLTTAQLQTLKTYIESVPAWAALPKNSDSAFFIAAELNKPSNPTFNVWRTDAPVAAIIDAITWDKFTATDPADTTTIFLNRALLVQTKQMNLQLMLQGRETVDASKANVRAGLRDAVIQLPTGTGGALATAGGNNGVNVLNACTRNATLGEQVLATGSATTGTVTAGLMGFEGELSYSDVEAAWSA